MRATEILTASKNYCESLIKQNICNDLPFHNWQHTQEVYLSVRELGNLENLNYDDMLVVSIAAYFHDVGQIKGPSGHEDRSAHCARNFLQALDVRYDIIEEVSQTIKATSLLEKPDNRVQQILRDADLAHLGLASFKSKNEKLREEWKLLGLLSCDDLDWVHLNIEFLIEHHYFTQSAKQLFLAKKNDNLKDLYRLKEQLENNFKKAN